VAAGLAKFLDVEVLIVRAVFVALCFVSGLGVALYLGAWAVLADTGSKNTVPGEIVMRSWYR
jgi:phage shock protein PspC (stress-responsive transcriptional regulator)